MPPFDSNLNELTRRAFLGRSAGGIGGLALASLLARTQSARAEVSAKSWSVTASNARRSIARSDARSAVTPASPAGSRFTSYSSSTIPCARSSPRIRRSECCATPRESPA